MDQKNNILGFQFQIISMVSFISMDMIVKIVSQTHMPLYEIIFYRSVVGLPFVAMYLASTNSLHILKINRPKYHIYRAVAGIITTYCLFAGFKYLPFSEAYTLMYVSPIFLTLLSVIFLKERIYWHRTMALVMGLLGTIVIMQPSSQGMNWYYLYPLAGAFGLATVAIIGHYATKTESPTGITVTFFVFMGAVTGAMTAYKGFTPLDDMWVLIYIVLMGNLGALAQIFNMKAVKTSDPSFFAVTKYMGLLIATAVGILLFKEPLTTALMLGVALIGCSGIYMVWREHKK